MGQPGVVTPSDMADLALRRCYQHLDAGEAAVPVRDAVAIVRLAREIERDQALAELGKIRTALGKTRARQPIPGPGERAQPCKVAISGSGGRFVRAGGAGGARRGRIRS